jgi:hypothetical protein
MVVILIFTVLFFIILSFTPLLVASEPGVRTSVFLR